MKNLKLKAYTKDNKNIVLDSIGMHAFMHLTTLLWNDKTKAEKVKRFKTNGDTITIETNDHIYEFTNVPILWDGSIDVHTIYADHIQNLQAKGVI